MTRTTWWTLFAIGGILGAGLGLALGVILGALVTPAFGAEPVSLPDLSQYTPLGVQTLYCGETVGALARITHNRIGSDPSEADLMTYGPNTVEAPWLYLVFDTDADAPPTHVILALPGKPVEKLTFGELKARYGGPCDLLLEAGKPL